MKVCSYALVIVLLGLVMAILTTSRAAIIGLDNRYPGSFESLWETDYDDFRAAISSAGHVLVPLSSFTTSNLTNLDAVILLQPFYPEGVFTTDEISAVHSFFQAGHGVLVIANQGSGTDSTVQNFNVLAGAFGVTYADTALHPNGYTVTGFVAHPVTVGVNSIGVDYDRRLSGISSPAQDLTLLAGENEILAAVRGTNGQGNVVLVSDSNMWTDLDAHDDRNLAFGDNLRLLQNSIAFITPPRLAIAATADQQLQLFWGAYYSGYTLERTTNLPAVTWWPVTNSVYVTNNFFSVTIDRNATHQFFRLRKL
jgi:hypothetical protein